MAFTSLLKRLEVRSEDAQHDTAFSNDDLKPVEPARRTWGPRQYAELWILVNMNIAGYTMGSSLVSDGLTFWQAIIAIIIGKLLGAVFCTIASASGAYYHIGYPAISRIAWGVYGSTLAVLIRLLPSIVWFAVQAWNGGLCILVCLRAIWPGHIDNIPQTFSDADGFTGAQFMCFWLFLLVCIPFTWVKPHKLRIVFMVSSVVVFINQFIMMIWALATMDGSFQAGSLRTDLNYDSWQLGWAMVRGIMAAIGAIASGILNQNDYTRFAKAPERRSIMVQALSFPITAFLTALFGILITAATAERYGSALWNPPVLLMAVQKAGGSRSRAATFFCALSWVLSQVSINTFGNLLAAGLDMSSLMPRYITLRRGGFVVMLLSIACNPWKLVSTSTIFLNVLSAYAIFMGPMTAILVATYYIVQKKYFKISDVYDPTPSGIYYYTYGVNWRAIAAFLFGIAMSITGFVGSVGGYKVSAVATRFYDMSYVLGFCVAFVLYIVLHIAFPVQRQRDFVNKMQAMNAPQTYDGLQSLLRTSPDSCDAVTYTGVGNESGAEPKSLKEQEVRAYVSKV